MSDETQGLQSAIAALQAKNLQLDEKLRALEQSYTIDKRTVYVVGAALSAVSYTHLRAHGDGLLSRMPSSA